MRSKRSLKSNLHIRFNAFLICIPRIVAIESGINYDSFNEMLSLSSQKNFDIYICEEYVCSI